MQSRLMGDKTNCKLGKHGKRENRTAQARGCCVCMAVCCRREGHGHAFAWEKKKFMVVGVLQGRWAASGREKAAGAGFIRCWAYC